MVKVNIEQRTVMVPSTEEIVVLEISKEQAKVLQVILGAISGSPKGPRGETKEIYYALCKVNKNAERLHLDPKYARSGGIYFEN